MRIEPENAQHGSRADIESVTIETLGEFAAVAAGCSEIIRTKMQYGHPESLVARKYAPLLGFILPDSMYAHIDDHLQKHIQKIIARDPELNFMQGIVDEHVPYEVDGTQEFTARTYVGSEAVMVVSGLWYAVGIINGHEAAQSLVSFSDDSRRPLAE